MIDTRNAITTESIGVPIKDVMPGIVVLLELTGLRFFKLRLRLAVPVFALANWIGGFKSCEIEVAKGK